VPRPLRATVWDGDLQCSMDLCGLTGATVPSHSGDG
jgi:hypothetical protein